MPDPLSDASSPHDLTPLTDLGSGTLKASLAAPPPPKFDSDSDSSLRTPGSVTAARQAAFDAAAVTVPLAELPAPPLTHRIATVMVVNLLIPVAVLALFKGFGDYHAAYDQTYGRAERWAGTLANVWEPILVEFAPASTGSMPAPLLPSVGANGLTLPQRLTRAAHRLVLEHQRDLPFVEFIALFDADGALQITIGQWSPDALEKALQRLPAPDDLAPGGLLSHGFSQTGGAEQFVVYRPVDLSADTASETPNAAASLNNADRVLVLVVFDSTIIRRQFRLRIVRLLALDIGLAVLVGVLGWMLVYRFVVQPVRQLHDGVSQVAAGNLRHRLRAESPDELGLLAIGFNVMAERLDAGYRELQHRNQRLRADRAYAGRLHKQLLPAQLPEPEGFRFAAAYQPCEDLGGDFYDVFELDHGRVALYVADVSGHGIGAALITVFIRETIARLRDGDDRSLPAEPARTLSAIRDRFTEENFGSLFVTMVYGILDGRAGTFRFAAAGHPMPLLAHGGLVREVAAENEGGPIIGGFMPADMPFPEHEITLPVGSRLLLYTDGATDVQGPDGRSFGLSRLRRLLLAPAVGAGGAGSPPPANPATTWTQHALRAMLDHVGPRPLTDDVTLLLVTCQRRPVDSPDANGS